MAKKPIEACVRLVIVKPIKVCATHAAAWSFGDARCTAVSDG